MHRILVDTEQLFSSSPVLSKEALKHLRVLRPKEGEPFELFDGCGNGRTFSYRHEAGENSPLSSCDDCIRHAAPPVPLTLFACVTKGSRWDWTIEKATELGVTRLVPVISERTIVRIPPSEREAKRTRWQRIAEEAARQSDAFWRPEIEEPVTFAESLSLVRETTCFVGAITNPPPPMIADAVKARRLIADAEQVLGSIATEDKSHSVSRNWALYVGPEGDFTPEELASLVAIAVPVSFGSTILRAETAAIYGVSVLKSFLDAADPAVDSRTPRLGGDLAADPVLHVSTC